MRKFATEDAGSTEKESGFLSGLRQKAPISLIPVDSARAAPVASVVHLFLVMAALVFSTQCAMTSVHHIAVTNWTDRHITPDSRAAQWAMTPVLVPVCLVTLLIDNFIVAPIAQLPSAFEDAGDFFTHRVGGYFTEAGLSPFRLVLTPVVFAGSWIIRSFFGFDPKENAAWSWPEWGRQWVRNPDGSLRGPPP